MPKARKPIINFEEMVKEGEKKFVRYDEGAKLYSVCEKTFAEIAKEANAIYKIRRCCLVNVALVDQYLETFRVKE